MSETGFASVIGGGFGPGAAVIGAGLGAAGSSPPFRGMLLSGVSSADIDIIAGHGRSRDFAQAMTSDGR
jgi:hypothetical protein